MRTTASEYAGRWSFPWPPLLRSHAIDRGLRIGPGHTGIPDRLPDLVVVEAQDAGGFDQVEQARGRPLLQAVHGQGRFPIGD